MRKFLSFVVVFAFLVGVVPARAQGVGILGGGYWPSSWDGWYYYIQGDLAHMLIADQVNWVGETMNISRRAQMRRVTDDLMFYKSQVGLRTSRGFYPMYQCGKGQRIGRYAADISIGVLLGAAVGGKKGAAIGGGLGAAVAVREDLKCWDVQNRMVVVDDPSDLAGSTATTMPQSQQRVPSGRENGWNQILQNQANAGGGNPWFGSYRGCLQQGMFTLKNESGEVILVFQNGQPYISLLPMESKCGEPFASYDAVMVVAGSDNYTAVAGMPRAKPEGRKGGVWVWR